MRMAAEHGDSLDRLRRRRPAETKAASSQAYEFTGYEKRAAKTGLRGHGCEMHRRMTIVTGRRLVADVVARSAGPVTDCDER